MESATIKIIPKSELSHLMENFPHAKVGKQTRDFVSGCKYVVVCTDYVFVVNYFQYVGYENIDLLTNIKQLEFNG